MRIPLPDILIRPIKRLIPETLFGRALMILVVPILLVQMVAAYVFYERHWDNVTKHMSSSLAGEVAMILHQMPPRGTEEREEFTTIVKQLMSISIRFEAGMSDPFAIPPHDPQFEEFAYHLQQRLGRPFSVRAIANGDVVEIRIPGPEETMVMRVSIKRLASSTTYIFAWALFGTAAFVLIIATLFLRNQVRPIILLARAAERFGRGRDMPGFKPSGAKEVRQAAASFIEMKERLQRLIKSRALMLAGISHDLRTPLTRMRLQLAMLKGEDVEAMKGDVVGMEKMIAEYLDFARGEGGETPLKIPLDELIKALVEDYARQNAPVTITRTEALTLMLKPHAISRCLMNVIDNALRYGERAEIALFQQGNCAVVTVDDNGPGIKPEHRELVFQAFKRIDDSRNPETGGVGLGLTIVQDIIHSHGGLVALEDSPSGGLRVRVELPL